MVWGAWFLTAHGALSAVWLLAGWFGRDGVLTLLVLAGDRDRPCWRPSYTGFLFAQGLARDLWQGPYAAIDLIAQSGAAGSAALLLADVHRRRAGRRRRVRCSAVILRLARWCAIS